MDARWGGKAELEARMTWRQLNQVPLGCPNLLGCRTLDVGGRFIGGSLRLDRWTRRFAADAGRSDALGATRWHGVDAEAEDHPDGRRCTMVATAIRATGAGDSR